MNVTEVKLRDEAGTVGVATGTGVLVLLVADVVAAEGFGVSVFGDECEAHATSDAAATAMSIGASC